MFTRLINAPAVGSPGRALIGLLSIHLIVVDVPAVAQNEPDNAQSSDETQPEPRASNNQYAQAQRDLRTAEPAIHAQTKRIERELAALAASDLPEDHWAREWAGEYYVGDGLGMNVVMSVAPEAGITYTWHGCMGLYDGNLGAVTKSFDLDADGRADGLTIDWELSGAPWYDYASKAFYFVRWKGPEGEPGRHYLVPESKMLDVVNDYNAGSYARDNMYSAPLKNIAGERAWRGSHRAVEGVPELPAKWSKLLLLEPVDAVVTNVSPITRDNVTNGVDQTRARVVLDKGSADGLYLGLSIRLPDPLIGGTLTVDTLDEHSAECEFRAFFLPNNPVTPPQVGKTIRVIQGADAPTK